MDYSKYIGVTEGFPREGISFKDISPLLRDPEAFKSIVDQMAKDIKRLGANVVIGPESRGFICGGPAAYAAGVGFVMARKAGKLPGKVVSETYTLEYAEATIELPEFAIKKGDKVVIIDDIMATGGTFKAVQNIVERMGGEVVGFINLIELTDLKGRDVLGDIPYISYIKYPH